jgi:hypothetical protein
MFANAWDCRDRLDTAMRFLRGVLNVWEADALSAPYPDKRQRRSLRIMSTECN